MTLLACIGFLFVLILWLPLKEDMRASLLLGLQLGIAVDVLLWLAVFA